MLDTTVSARVLAAAFVGLVAASLLGAAWLTDRPILGMFGLAVANVCVVLVIQRDHVKTRRAVRLVLRDMNDRTLTDMRSVR